MAEIVPFGRLWRQRWRRLGLAIERTVVGHCPTCKGVVRAERWLVAPYQRLDANTRAVVWASLAHAVHGHPWANNRANGSGYPPLP